ncbi:MAG: hypothetical protein KF746_17450 [Chitinophagaceae bacterium]|nr:hypothetical protein [Chitinophagaceae bacterium]
MIIFYNPLRKIFIDETALEFGEKRESIRRKLGKKHIVDDQILQIGDSDTDVIYQRRDIYQNLNATKNYFFLGYNENDLLSEVEIHNCDKIKVNDFVFNFNDDLTFIASGLSKYSSVIKYGDGEYLLSDIKVSLLDKSQMGEYGDHHLGYFYCAEDVTHLERFN